MRTGDAVSALWFFFGPTLLLTAVVLTGRIVRHFRRNT